jgi:hypothetical protein
MKWGKNKIPYPYEKHKKLNKNLLKSVTTRVERYAKDPGFLQGFHGSSIPVSRFSRFPVELT